MSTNRTSLLPFRVVAILVVLAMFLAPIAGLIPGAYATETITIVPTQAVYLVNNGDTANVGFKMTYTGEPDTGTGLDRDITLVITTGTSLQVGGAPGNAQNVATTLAGGIATIAGGNTTLVAGTTTLAAASVAGVSNIKMTSVSNFAVGQTVNIDTGANLESATIAVVGAGGSTTLGWPAAIGDTNIKVPNIASFVAGRTIYIDTGANLESAVVAVVGTAGATGVRTATAIGATSIPVTSTTGFVVSNTITIDTGTNAETAVILSTTGGGSPSITVATPLGNAHAVGAMVAGSGITLAAPLALAHASGAAVTGNGLTLASPLTLAHASGAAIVAVTPIGTSMIRVNSVSNFAAGQTANIDTGANLESATIATVGVGGSTTLGWPAAIGDTNIKVPSVANFVAGGTIYLDIAANLESAVVATVGSAGATTVRIATDVGATIIPVASSTGFAAGNTITIDTGANAATAVIQSVTGGGSPSITIVAPLANAHAVGAMVAGSGITLAAPLTLAHVSGTAVTGNGLTLASSFTLAHAGAATVATLTPIGATNIKVSSVTGFVVSQTINIDTGANLETATIANVGTSGATGTGLDLTAGLTISHTGAPAVVQTAPSAVAGATNIKVNSVMGYYTGDTINIDTGANIERRTILAVGTAGVSGTGIDLDTPLTLPHAAGVSATDTRVLPSTAVLGTDYTVVSNTVIIPAGSISGTIVTIPIVTLPNPNPSVALTINTTTGCVTGCTGVTVNNNDPSTVVINAHGFPYLNSALPVATRVADLMSRMSLFDKVGQMAQTNMTVLTNGTTTNESSYNGVRAWRLGSILSGGTDSPTPNSPTGWANLVDSFEYRALATPLQIPLIYGIDTIHGNSHMIGSVLFPHDIGMGAAHNPDLSYQQGVITAQETRSTGPQWGFGPTICVDRDIRWGRTYECYSEDPDLVNLMEPIIEGYQGSNPLDMSGVHIVASAKHFAGDGATQNGTNTGVDVMSSEEFARVALAPYIPAVQTYHAGTIMPSYSSTQLDGATTSIKMSANADLMTGWLKQQTGFDGFLISDYNAIDQIPVPSPNPLPAPINNSYAYQAMISFNAGMDMVMAPNNPAWKNFINYVQTLVKTGYMEQSRIDDAVRRILMQKFALGLFEQPFTDRSTQNQILSAEHRAVAREATAQSQVLLKNVDNILPLSKTANIYLAGSNAHSVINQAGGWSISWQSIPTGDVAAVDTYFTTIREAIQNVVGTGNITYSVTASPAPVTGTYDVGIVVVGEGAYAEGSGDVPSQTNATTAADATAINNVCNVMPCIIMTVSGRPFWLTDAQFNTAEAVVASWIGSSEGDGMADVLFGDHAFTGRLPMTWSRSVAQEPINVGDATYDPRFPYGWGLRIGTTFSTKSSLQTARNSLAAISGDAHVTAAVAALDSLLAANVWNPDGSVSDPGATLRALQVAANELAATSAESFTQDDGVVSAARDIALANVVRNGGPDATSSPLIANAEHELMISHPDVAVTLLTQAAGDVLPPTTSATLEPTPVNGWYTTTPTVTLTAVDAESGVARTNYRIDSSIWQTYTIPFQVTGDGQHLVDFFSVDMVGNVESTQSITLSVDALGPIATITPDRAPLSTGWYTGTVTFTATATSAAGLSVTCDAPKVYSSPDTITASVTMTCTDTVGMTGRATANFKFDKTAPTVAPSVSPNPVLFNNPATASVNAADVTAGINVTATTCSAPSTTTMGTKTVTCTATDNAGNRSALGVAVYTVVYPFTGVSPEVIHTGTGPTGYEVTLRYYDPTATKVYVRGEWSFSIAASTTLTSSLGLPPSQWVPGAFPMASGNWPMVTMTLNSTTGVWSYTTPMPPGLYTYYFYRNCPNAYPSTSGCTAVYDPGNMPWNWNAGGATEPNSQVYVPSDSAFGGEDYSWLASNSVHGTLSDVTYPSPQSTNPVGYHYLAVYLPPNYNPNRAIPYPTLYLSHGASGNEVDWSTQGATGNLIDNLIATGKAQPMVVVMTNFNSISGGTDGYRTDVISNVIPYVESHYNVSHNGNDRAFGGLSAGAQRANNILFNATTAFGYVGSWSIGGSGSPVISSTLWQNPDLKTRLGIHIGGGRFDSITVPGINTYEANLTANGIPFVDDRMDGAHTWDVWRHMLLHFANTMAFKHTTTSVVADSNPTWMGSTVTFTATVTKDTTEPAALSGTVKFYRGTPLDAGHLLGTANVDSSGHATLTVSNLSTGAYDVTAVYSGDNFYNTSTAALSHLVFNHQIFLPLVVK